MTIAGIYALIIIPISVKIVLKNITAMIIQCE